MEWRNRLIWGDKKYVLPSLLPELAGRINLIYVDPPLIPAQISHTQRQSPNNDGQPDERIRHPLGL